jgi:hypothetical protein
MGKNEHKDLHESHGDCSSQKLNDEELENVGGGILGITILDSCQKQWDKGICWGAIWGACPNLLTISSETTPFEYTDVYKCEKGYFNSVTVVRPAMSSTSG